MKFGSITDGYGAPITGGGSAGAYHTLDAATTHQYKCIDASGNLINSVTGNANPLVVSGSPIYQDPGLFARGTTAIRWDAANSSDRAEATGLSLTPSSGCTLEAIIEPTVQPSDSIIVEVATSAPNRTDGLIHLVVLATGAFEVNVYIGGSPSPVAYTSQVRSGRIHVMATYANGTNALILYVNGVLAASGTCGALSGKTMTKIAIGGATGGIGAPYRGLVADVRFTPAILTQAYAIAATKAMGAL